MAQSPPVSQFKTLYAFSPKVNAMGVKGLGPVKIDVSVQSLGPKDVGVESFNQQGFGKFRVQIDDILCEALKPVETLYADGVESSPEYLRETQKNLEVALSAPVLSALNQSREEQGQPLLHHVTFHSRFRKSGKVGNKTHATPLPIGHIDFLFESQRYLDPRLCFYEAATCILNDIGKHSALSKLACSGKWGLLFVANTWVPLVTKLTHSALLLMKNREGFSPEENKKYFCQLPKSQGTGNAIRAELAMESQWKTSEGMQGFSRAVEGEAGELLLFRSDQVVHGSALDEMKEDEPPRRSFEKRDVYYFSVEAEGELTSELKKWVEEAYKSEEGAQALLNGAHALSGKDLFEIVKGKRHRILDVLADFSESHEALFEKCLEALETKANQNPAFKNDLEVAKNLPRRMGAETFSERVESEDFSDDEFCC